MYICKDCFEIFDEPAIIAEDLTPGGACEGESFIYKCTSCPYCGGRAYEEVKICDICETALVNNEYELATKDNCIVTCCKECYKEIENNEN